MESEKNGDIFNCESAAKLRGFMEDCRHGGPSIDEGQISFAPWFPGAQLMLGWPAPSDDLATGAASDDAIRGAIRDTAEVIEDHFGDVQGDARGARFLGAIAVDAWIGNDLTSCRKFLMKAVILDMVQRIGLPQLYRDLDPTSDISSDIVAEIRKCLSPNDQVLIASLEYVTRGACMCIRLIQAMRNGSKIDPSGTLLSDDATLPPSLRSHSKLWSLKKHGAANLKAGDYVKAVRLYGKVLSLIKKDLDFLVDAAQNGRRASSIEERELAQLARTSRTDMIQKLSKEKAKIESNLSLIYLKQGKAGEALQYAELAASSKPNWEKAHGRRGLALEKLQRYEDASAAFSNAIEITHKRMESAAEYEEMRERVEQMIGSRKPTSVDAVTSVAASSSSTVMCPLSSFLVNKDIEFSVIQWCTPRDVTQLAQTCRYFASCPERRRHIARVGKLIGQEDLEEIVHVYCCENCDDPQSTFSHLVTSLVTQTDPQVPHATGCLNTPEWLSTLLSDYTISVRDRELMWEACANVGKGAMHQIMINTGNYGAFKWLLRSDSASPKNKFKIFSLASFQEGDSENIAQKLTQAYSFDFDGELFRLVANASNDGSGAVGGLANPACLWLYNLILSRGTDLQQNSEIIKSITEQNIELASMYAIHFPHRWPCEDGVIETRWEYSAQEISFYWSNSNSREFRRWKGGMSACFRWLGGAEKSGYKLFLLKKSLEHGGSRALFKTLDTQERHADFIAEFYSVIRLYRVAFPKVFQWRDTLASHYGSSA